jgi:transcription termination factor NusB
VGLKSNDYYVLLHKLYAMNLSPEDLQQQLAEAAKELLYPSETDAPFVPFAWQNMHEITTEKLMLATRHKVDTPVEGMELDDFFAPVTRVEEWLDDRERATALRFQELKETLQNYLTDISVYRVGIVNVDVYIVGMAEGGYVAGVATKLVET